ncbi:MAG TPA: carboxymuconolactone decarboxylase family protein [Terriglobia bacterium]|jgi:4-carboxymuconolactone decarboxylase|nr:carboxymuconolactone decarboxylase family protein [Terriglobia bacterium]
MSDKGFEMMRRMMGSTRAEEARAAWSKLSPDFARMIEDFVAGEVWTRSGLELKIRSLVTIGALAALGRANALRLNIEMGLNNGATRTEITEAILQLVPYAGFPAVWDALIVADDVFRGKRGDEFASPQRGSSL